MQSVVGAQTWPELLLSDKSYPAELCSLLDVVLAVRFIVSMLQPGFSPSAVLGH